MEHEGVDLVGYVHTMLKEHVSLKHIGASFGITHPQQSKW
jgi:hypothetical protein